MGGGVGGDVAIVPSGVDMGVGDGVIGDGVVGDGVSSSTGEGVGAGVIGKGVGMGVGVNVTAYE